MFYLTAEERKFMAIVVIIFTAGAGIQWFLHRDIALMRWVKSVRQFKIHINSAGREQFQMLPGFGARLSQRIVYYRQAHGPFASLEDLCKVKGLSLRRFVRIKELMTL